MKYIVLVLLVILIVYFIVNCVDKENFDVINNRLIVSGHKGQISGYNDFNPNYGLLIDWNNELKGETDFINNGQGGYGGYSFSTTNVNNQGIKTLFRVDDIGNATIYGNNNIGNTLTVTGSTTINGSYRENNNFYMNSNGVFQIDAPNVPGGRLNIDKAGNVIIGNGLLVVDPSGNVMIRGNLTYSGSLTDTINPNYEPEYINGTIPQ